MVPAYRARTGKNARSTADTNNVGNEPANQNTARPAIHSSTRARSPLLFKGGAPVQLAMPVSRKPATAAGTRPYIMSWLRQCSGDQPSGRGKPPSKKDIHASPMSRPYTPTNRNETQTGWD